MAKKPVQQGTPKGATSTTTTTASQPPRSASNTQVVGPTATLLSAKSSPQEVALHVWNKYLNDTPTRTMFLDMFMLFLVLLGAVQFLYCLLVGNYVSFVLFDRKPLT